MPKLQKKTRLLHSSLTVGCLTMLSRIFGLIRDIVIAGYFGSTAGADAFFIAFRIPNLFRRLFAEGAFSQAFVPVLSEYKTKESHDSLKQFLNYTAGTLGGVLCLVTLAGSLLAPFIIHLFAPGFYDDPHKMKLAGTMLQITFTYLPLISLTAFAGAIMNTFGFFSIPALTPVLLNLSLIGTAIWVSPFLSPNVMALAWGVLIAGILQLSFQVPFLYRIDALPKPCWGWKHSGVQRILKLMLPALFGVSVAQINLLFDSILASFLQTGSVSWLYYADRLTELPLGVFGVAIASVILPTLSKHHATNATDAYSKTMDWAIRLILLIALPATLALIILAEPVLTTIFFHGEMSPHDIYMSAGSLKAFSVGLTAFMLVKVLAPAFYSKQNTKTPVKIALISLIANMVFNLMFIWSLKHVGLALATSLSSMLNAFLLFYTLRRKGMYRSTFDWTKLCIQLFISISFMSVVLVFFNYPTEMWLNWTSIQRIKMLSLLIGSGFVIYVIAMFTLGLRWKDLHD